MTEFLQALPTVAVWVVAIVVVGGLFFGFLSLTSYLADGDHGFLAAMSVLAAIGVVVVGIVALDVALDGGSGADGHRWRGGSGPATVCVFETEQEVSQVGKVPVTNDVVYTVCRDPR